jgi:hypothetical protein
VGVAMVVSVRSRSAMAVSKPGGRESAPFDRPPGVEGWSKGADWRRRGSLRSQAAGGRSVSHLAGCLATVRLCIA